MSKKNKQNNIFLAIVIGISTLLISLFLSGKIILIPHGTQEGGIISAVGVAVILLINFVIIFGINRIFYHKKNVK